MDRLLNDISSDRSGPVARAIQSFGLSGINTTGQIDQNAAHWAIERFIPVQAAPLVKFLSERDELSANKREQFLKVCENIQSIQYEQTRSYLGRFAAAYAGIDPDNDCRDPLDGEAAEPASPDSGNEVDQQAVDSVIELCDEILHSAGYTKLGRADIEQCAETVSQFGVPLHVDFDLFDQLDVYARGDIVGTRYRRRLMNLYRRESVDVPLYQRMVTIFQLADDDDSDEDLISSALHLRMFKNIPKLDIDMLLPGTRVRIRGFDRAKFILPSVGGFLISVRRIAQYTAMLMAFLAFTAIAISKSLILVVLIAALMIRGVFNSIFGYFRTKRHYQLNLTRNLYFQKLDSNAGVAYRIIQQAERQRIVEMIFAYFGLLIAAEPVSERKLRRRCERLVREAINVEVNFHSESALQELAKVNLVSETDAGWQAT